MAARRNTAGRIMGIRKLAGATLAIAAATLLLATEMPRTLVEAGRGSAALAELAARSPGMRVGGVALKAKTPRSALAPLADAGPVASVGPGTAVATVLGAGPDGAAPTSGAVGPGGFPSDFLSPPPAGALGPVGAGSGSAPAIDFGNTPFPLVGGAPIFVGGGSSGGGGGGSGGTGTMPTDGDGAPGGDLVPPPPPPNPGAVGIPEPATWLMLIAGFGVIGGAMRRNGRVRFAR